MRRNSRGFTLLETIIAMAILALALMAIFDMNSGAIAMHAYTKRLTVATLLARSKMTDIEQELYDKGFQADDDEMDGDFSDEGWPSFKWRAKIIAPKTDGVPPEQVISAVFNIPLDGSGDMGKMLAGKGADKLAAAAKDFGGITGPLPPGATAGAGGLAAMLGPMAGMATQQLGQMVTQITQTVREVHLTVSWKDGKNVESVDVVTHVVSLGQGGDRNGASGPGGINPAAATGPATWNPKTNAPAANPLPCQNDPDPTHLCEGGDPSQRLIPNPNAAGLAGQGINPPIVPPNGIDTRGPNFQGLGKINFGPRPPPGRIQ